MSDLWFNIRVLWWHVQIRKGRLIRPRFSFNHWHWFKQGLKPPVQVYEFSLREGWRERNSKAYDTYSVGQAP